LIEGKLSEIVFDLESSSVDGANSSLGK